jgi:hypothetical protein
LIAAVFSGFPVTEGAKTRRCERCALTFVDPDGNLLVLAVLQRDALW